MSETFFKVVCPKCSKKHAVPANYVGKVVLCQPCGKRFRVNEPKADPITFRQAQHNNEYDMGASAVVDVREMGLDEDEVDLSEHGIGNMAAEQQNEETIDSKVRLSATDIFEAERDDED